MTNILEIRRERRQHKPEHKCWISSVGRQTLLPMGGDKTQWREICSFGGKLRDMFLMNVNVKNCSGNIADNLIDSKGFVFYFPSNFMFLSKNRQYA